MNIEFIRRAGQTKRYHTEVVLQEQNVGEHSFNVAWMCVYLTGGAASRALLMHALAHDAAEHTTGDIPSPSKRALNIRERVGQWEAKLIAASGVKLDDLIPYEAHVLKLADALDGLLYCQREIQLGNRLIYVVWCNFRNYLYEQMSMGTCVENNVPNVLTAQLIDKSADAVTKIFGVAA